VANRNALCVNCLPLLPKKVDIGVCVYITKEGKMENMYENMQHNVVCTTCWKTSLYIGGIQSLLIQEAILCTDES
jgi:hypothetical protein